MRRHDHTHNAKGLHTLVWALLYSRTVGGEMSMKSGQHSVISTCRRPTVDTLTSNVSSWFQGESFLGVPRTESVTELGGYRYDAVVQISAHRCAEEPGIVKASEEA
jgi:hypothetical protein